MNAAEIATRLRWIAECRQTGYGRGTQAQRDEIVNECDVLRMAADVAEGKLEPMYSLLPAWNWTDEMNADLDRRSGR